MLVGLGFTSAQQQTTTFSRSFRVFIALPHEDIVVQVATRPTIDFIPPSIRYHHQFYPTRGGTHQGVRPIKNVVFAM